MGVFRMTVCWTPCLPRGGSALPILQSALSGTTPHTCQPKCATSGAASCSASHHRASARCWGARPRISETPPRSAMITFPRQLWHPSRKGKRWKRGRSSFTRTLIRCLQTQVSMTRPAPTAFSKWAHSRKTRAAWPWDTDPGTIWWLPPALAQGTLYCSPQCLRSQVQWQEHQGLPQPLCKLI